MTDAELLRRGESLTGCGEKRWPEPAASKMGFSLARRADGEIRWLVVAILGKGTRDACGGEKSVRSFRPWRVVLVRLARDALPTIGR